MPIFQNLTALGINVQPIANGYHLRSAERQRTVLIGLARRRQAPEVRPRVPITISAVDENEAIRHLLSVCPTSGFMPPYDSGTRHPFLLAQAG